MNHIITEPTSTAQWHSLVHEAEDIAHQQLSETLESYLVFTLIRFTRCPELANAILGIEFLESMQRSGARRARTLRDVGDKCLLFSGLFPHLAKRRRVRSSYFVDLGRSAYFEVHNTSAAADSSLYRELAREFVAMSDVLNTLRSLDQSKPELDPLSAYELWEDTDSQFARKAVIRRAEHGSEVTLLKATPNSTPH